MPWIVGGAIVGGALLSKSSADKAASGQVAAANSATAEQRRQFDLSRQDLAPWRTAGSGAIGDLSQRLFGQRGPGQTTTGFIPQDQFDANAYLKANPDVAAAGADPYQHYLQFGQNEGRQGFTLGAPSGDGDLMRKFTMQDFLNDPVNQAQGTFALDEGRKAIERRAAAMGGWDSGATLKALTRYGSDYGAQRAGEAYNRFVGDQANQFNRLASVAGIGQTAANTTATLGANAATNIGQNTMQAANARGAAGVAGANAFTGGVNTGLNYYQGQQLLNRLTPPQPQAPAWNPFATGDFPAMQDTATV